MMSVTIHMIAYSLLVITLIRMALAISEKNKAINELFYYNEQVVNRFNEVYEELVNTQAELQLTKNNRDMYLEDRTSLIENMKAFLPKQK